MIWEISRYDWALLRAEGSAAQVPFALISMCNAIDEEAANSSYWNIDGCVISNGSMYESCIATSACLVAGLQICTPLGLQKYLELLVQISQGEIDDTEVALNNSELKTNCLVEIRKGWSFYLDKIEHADTDTALYCIDLIGMTAQGSNLCRQAIQYFVQYQNKCNDKGVSQLLKNWICELSPMVG